MFQVGGNLRFHWNHRSKEADLARELLVDTIERKENTTPPEVLSDNPFLVPGQPAISERPHATDRTLVGRTYRYPVRLTPPPEAESFGAELAVIDPWMNGKKITILVYGEYRAPVEAIPARLVLETADSPSRRGRPRFLVKTEGVQPRIDLGPEPSPLGVELIHCSDTMQIFTYEVKYNGDSGQPPAGEVYRVKIIAGTEPQDEAEVLVKTVHEGGGS